MGLLAVASCLALPAAVSAHEAFGNVDNGRKIYQEGKGDVPACQGCHRQDGLGDDSMGTPRLAYQVDSYIFKQLKDFAANRRTDDTMFAMNDVAKGLSEQDKRDVAAYVHTLKTPSMGSNLEKLKADGVEVGEPYKGKMIVEYGAPDRGIPACKSCHGFHGRSAGRMFPALVRQNYVYLKHELESFRNGYNKYGTKTLSKDELANKEDNERVNDFMGQMRAVAGHLTDEDIKNLAAFLTVAKPNTPGNPRTPSRQ